MNIHLCYIRSGLVKLFQRRPEGGGRVLRMLLVRDVPIVIQSWQGFDIDGYSTIVCMMGSDRGKPPKRIPSGPDAVAQCRFKNGQAPGRWRISPNYWMLVRHQLSFWSC